MTLSYNIHPGGKMYAPARDFAYNYPEMLSCIIRCFNTEKWPELLDVTTEARFPVGPDPAMTLEERKEATWDEICTAKDVYCEFLKICCEDPAENEDDVLRRAGWFDLHPAIQMSFLAMMGVVMTGQFFQGLRDVTPGGTVPSEIAKLLQAGDNARKAMMKTEE